MQKGIFCDAEFYLRTEPGFSSLYVRVPAGSPALRYTVKTVCAGDCYFPLDLGLLKDHPAYTAKTEVLTSAEGLSSVNSCEIV